jgi:hypothetical protein
MVCSRIRLPTACTLAARRAKGMRLVNLMAAGVVLLFAG